MILFKERLRQKAIKDKEKERTDFYNKQKEGQKDARAKYREKVGKSVRKVLTIQVQNHYYNIQGD